MSSRAADTTERLLTEAVWVRRLATTLAPQSADAEDLSQEAWLAALQQPPNAADGPRLRAWLRTVLDNLARRARRTAGRRQRRERAAARPEAREDDGIERAQRHRAVLDAVLSLGEPYRTAIVQRFLDGLDHAEIARRAGISAAAARQRVSRGLAMLRARLGADHHPPNALAGTLFGTGVLVAHKFTVSAAAVVLALSLVWVFVPLGAAPPRLDENVIATATSGGPASDPSTDAQPTVPAIAAPATRRLIADAPAALAGTVTDTLGTPIAGAWVQLEDTAGAALADVERAIADAGGAFVMPLPTTTLAGLFVRAGSADCVETRAQLEDAQRLILHRLPIVAGIVVDAAGVPVARPGEVGLTIVDGGEERAFEAAVDAAGRFRAAVAVGELRRATARAKGHGSGTSALQLDLRVDTTTQIEIRLPAGAIVEGTVVDDRGDPIAGARVWVNDWEWHERTSRPTTRTDAQGRFRLAGVDPRRHVTGDGTVLALFDLLAASDAHAASRTRLFAAPWNQAQRYEFDVRLDAKACELGVRVIDPDRAGVAGLHVHVIDALQALHFATTDRDGRAAFADLPAGTAHVFVWSGNLDDDRGAVAHQAVLQSGANALELHLQPLRGAVSGTLRNGDGRAIAGATVTINFNIATASLRASMDSREVQTDAAGRYVLTRLPPGVYEIAPHAGDRRCAVPGRRLQDVGSAAIADLDFVIAPAMIIAGRVEGGGGDLTIALRDPTSGEVIANTDLRADRSFRLTAPTSVYELTLERDGRSLDRASVGPRDAADVVLRAR